MPVSRTAIRAVYAAVGVVALIGTWGNNLHYLGGGFVETNLRFWGETFANPASRSITVDVLCLSSAAIAWMFLEARRLGMRGAWAYFFGGLFVAMGVAFPLFLLHRERVLAARDGSAAAGRLSRGEMVGIGFVALTSLAYAVFSLAG